MRARVPALKPKAHTAIVGLSSVTGVKDRKQLGANQIYHYVLASRIEPLHARHVQLRRVARPSNRKHVSMADALFYSGCLSQ